MKSLRDYRDVLIKESKVMKLLYNIPYFIG